MQPVPTAVLDCCAGRDMDNFLLEQMTLFQSSTSKDNTISLQYTSAALMQARYGKSFDVVEHNHPVTLQNAKLMILLIRWAWMLQPF